MEKVKLGLIADSVEALTQLSKAKLPKVPTKTKYWLSKLVNKVKSEFANYEEVRISLVKEFGEEQKDEEGKSIGFSINSQDQEKAKAFFDKFNELREQEVELDFTKIKLDDMEGTSEEISVDMLSVLSWIIEE